LSGDAPPKIVAVPPCGHDRTHIGRLPELVVVGARGVARDHARKVLALDDRAKHAFNGRRTTDVAGADEK
jgi:hypothetical protein